MAVQHNSNEAHTQQPTCNTYSTPTTSLITNHPADTADAPQCCCGRADCAFRVHSTRLVENVKRDARTAGELGQALLIRHETYVASAEADRKHLLVKMDELETEKRAVERANQITIDENRMLLDRLESLNYSVAQSETHIQGLTETLSSTERELERLQTLAAHTEALRCQLETFEIDQESLQAQLGKTQDDERAAMLQYQQAQRTILSLHMQVEQIEREANEEKQRHADVLESIDRRKAVEADLRMSNTGGSTTPKSNGNGNGTVVSHFVRDILQDNANMQMSLMELREMLQQSNDEVEQLRSRADDHPSYDIATTTSLLPALRSPHIPLEPSALPAKELHVHHHYHAPQPTIETVIKSPRVHIRKAPKRRRAQMPGSGYSTPRSSSGGERFYPSSPMSISNANYSRSTPKIARVPQRWSVQSNQTAMTNSSSSLPGSPYTESVFDRAFGGTNTDASRPTSPESNGLHSPMVGRGTSNASATSEWGGPVKHIRNISEPYVSVDRSIYDDEQSANNSPVVNKTTIPRPSGLGISPIVEEAPPLAVTSNMDFDVFASRMPTSFSKDRRGSMISISGMDIHSTTTIASPTLLSMSKLSSAPVLSPQSTISVSLSVASATAVKPAVFARGGVATNASRTYLSSVVAARTPSTPAKTLVETGRSWLFGKWSTTDDHGSSVPSPSPVRHPPLPPTTPRTRTTSPPILAKSALMPLPIAKPKLKTAVTSPLAQSSPFRARPPGVNQAGPIFGFGPEPATPYRTAVGRDEVDLAALMEGLQS